MAVAKRALGRGLSALIPDEEMEILRRVARDDSANGSSKGSSTKGSSTQASVRKVFAGRASAVGAKPEKAGAADSGSPITPVTLSLNSADSGTQKTSSVKGVLGSDGLGLVGQGLAGQVGAESAEIKGNKRAAGAPESVEAVTSYISISDIEPNPYQPRRNFDESELDNLAASIGEHGIIQPIVVRPAQGGDKPYQLVAGERRWRASQRAGLQKIPAIVRPVDDLQALELALIENVQRHDISAIDAALAYRRLADDFHLSQEDIARRVGKSRSAVANTMRLLDLQPEIRKAIEDGLLSEGHGRAILLAQGDGARRALFRRVARDHLSVREVERLAKEKTDKAANASENERPDGASQVGGTSQGASSFTGEIRSKTFDTALLATRLEKRLGTRLKVQHGARGGRITIEYSSLQELQRLAELLLPS